jgi:hypothetical protein
MPEKQRFIYIAPMFSGDYIDNMGVIWRLEPKQVLSPIKRRIYEKRN